MGKVVVFGQTLLYSGKSGCIRAKLVVFGEKVVVLQLKWLYFAKTGSNWARLLYSGKVVVFGQKWLYLDKSGCIWAKVARKCCLIRAGWL